jgi:PIN domain nuclease of toxin-antitoxin system
LELGLILLDTHVVIWLALNPEKLSQKARAAILEARRKSGLAVASITLVEIAWQANRGRLQVTGTVEEFVRDCAAAVQVMPITVEIALQAVRLSSSYPKDPQDRLIGATAMVEGLALVTADESIRRSGVLRTIW